MTQANSDAGKLRNAIAAAKVNLHPGYSWGYLPTVYNDRRKDGTRRLKLYANCGNLFNAPQAQQKKVLANLRKAFGDRYLTGYFIKGGPWGVGGYHFCIVLAN